jgi:hypothetical protein
MHMKNYLYKIQALAFIIILSVFSFKIQAQICEWRLVNPTYSSTDPDGAGPATGSVTFTMQIHTVSGTINNVNAISTGWSYQSASSMIPTTPGCAVVSNPANVTISAAFLAGGFAFTTVNQCGAFSQMAGARNYDRRSVGTLDGTSINISTTYIDVYTVTLWTLGSTPPEGGYVIINSGAGGAPGEFTTYAVADDLANEYVANSLTFATPLALGSGALPVLFTKFEAGCTNNGALVSWSTGSEFNSNYFALQRSTNGNDWTSVATIKAAGNSSTGRTYQQLDLDGGKAYYRIKQVDMEGHFIYTGIIRTNCEPKKIDMVIYPVPARDILNVVIRSDKSLKTQLMLVDGIGKIVRRIDATLFNGSNTFLFNLKGLASGEYLIRSNNPAVELNKKFNIVR